MRIVLTIMCLFIANVADGALVDTLSLWGSERSHHKSDVEMHIFKPENSNGIGVIVCPGGIEHKYLQYDTGKHGFGVSDYYGSPESRQWRNEFLEWLGTLSFQP